MLTQCSRDLFGYEVVEGRRVVAAFDGGEVTSDAGGLLLGATDRAISPPASMTPGCRRRSSTASGSWWRSGCSVSRSSMRT
jgi:hypothetical protein